ncbi:hypothetical protein AB1Y20_007282 [Prymnesium parvum]|uniref:Uncharacterized protein n=1 Tax=Prymnesium parvum TaxID=97485 RepID=A0AB34IX65_PRYPA
MECTRPHCFEACSQSNLDSPGGLTFCWTTCCLSAAPPLPAAASLPFPLPSPSPPPFPLPPAPTHYVAAALLLLLLLLLLLAFELGRRLAPREPSAEAILLPSKFERSDAKPASPHPSDGCSSSAAGWPAEGVVIGVPAPWRPMHEGEVLPAAKAVAVPAP